MAWDDAREARVRADLAAVLEGAPLDQRRMFGGLALMTAGGHMICGLYSGGLFVRVGAGQCAAALARPGVEPMRMGGGGREMAGFVRLSPEAAADDGLRRALIADALALARSLPAKPAAGRRGQAAKTPL